MSLTFIYCSIIFILYICSVCTVYDIAVYGGTAGGVAAAITAARLSSSLSIILIEPTSYIGGMAAPGGIGLRDLGLEVTSKFNIIVLYSLYTLSFV